MAPLVQVVVRQSRTVRDVLVTSCMLDLAQEDVSTALDLGLARVEGLLRAAIAWCRVGLCGRRLDAASDARPRGWRAGLERLARRQSRTIETGIVQRTQFVLLASVASIASIAPIKPVVLASRRWVQKAWPILLLVAWFALPVSAVTGVCAALVGVELQMADP